MAPTDTRDMIAWSAACAEVADARVPWTSPAKAGGFSAGSPDPATVVLTDGQESRILRFTGFTPRYDVDDEQTSPEIQDNEAVNGFDVVINFDAGGDNYHAFMRIISTAGSSEWKEADISTSGYSNASISFNQTDFPAQFGNPPYFDKAFIESMAVEIYVTAVGDPSSAPLKIDYLNMQGSVYTEFNANGPGFNAQIGSAIVTLNLPVAATKVWALADNNNCAIRIRELWGDVWATIPSGQMMIFECSAGISKIEARCIGNERTLGMGIIA